MIEFKLLDGLKEERRERIDEILATEADRWAPWLNPEGTEARPMGAPAWWNEETAGQEALAGMTQLQRRVGKSV